MEKMCKIVQDILPTYIEKMTSEETNTFIEEHLKECENCRKNLEEMNSELEKENLKNTEVVKEIKKYKRKICTIKSIIVILILIILVCLIGKFGFRFYIVNKAFERNTNYDVGGNFTIHEYIDSVERDENHFITYHQGGKMKKVYGNTLLEYDDGKNHYIFDNENMTYTKEESKMNSNINVDISYLNGMENIVTNGKVNKLEILKYVLSKDNVYIQEEGFRDNDYYIIKNLEGEKVYLDKDTFFVARIKSKDLENDETEKMNDYYVTDVREYRIVIGDVGWRKIKEPDFSKYTLIENN